MSLATAAWVIHRLIGARPARSELARRALLGGVAVVLGAGLAAVMLLSLLEALHQTARQLARAAPRSRPRSIIALFFPEVLGISSRRRAGPQLRRAHRSTSARSPTLLAVAGLAARRPRGPQLFFAGLAVVSLAVALDTGPFSRAILHLPGLDHVALVRVLILASFAIAMLAVFGL